MAYDLDFIIGFEEGSLTEQAIIDGFQKMINDGSVWKLQGFYGRTAKSLLDAGLCTLPDKPTYDYYGNKVS